MRLIGMLDSPYVRRTAVSLELLGLPYAHEPVSVFRHYDAFAAVNPVVKAPTLVTDEGAVLMDSTLILQHLERLAPAERSLEPRALAEQVRSLRIVGLALAACEKTVQLVYEFNLRPAEKQHAPWIDRVRGQLAHAWRLLEDEMVADGWLLGARPMQADVTAAVAWGFARDILPDAADPAACPKLAALAARAEGIEAFKAAPMH
ncbi:glutathione S-transferase [Caulobacter sp. D4A]|uniref:glutathione S-transferase family protein n=1 Tax=unclassified Caulobacter TaxID=2648921 RepID=UPI000D725CAB|nr:MULTISPECIES: glutathione S-transferase [unclassified Caulobacter]PXA89229.1 glutathione S-transferase [Caulobacter sp. D5]PXA92047.1 glutathione S-transferase [Caulobacter sp. D4A]